jgi:hypothetical protein
MADRSMDGDAVNLLTMQWQGLMKIRYAHGRLRLGNGEWVVVADRSLEVDAVGMLWLYVDSLKAIGPIP